MGLKLGFHYHIPALFKEGQIYTPGYQAVFLDSLSPYCEKIICFLHFPRKEEISFCNSVIRSSNVELINIGAHSSVPIRTLFSRRYTAPIRKRKDEIDLLLIRGASPLLPAAAYCVPNLPKALLLVSSYVESIDSLCQPYWRKKLIRLWASWNESKQLEIAKKSITFVNSAKLYGELRQGVPNLIEIRTTTISDKDIHVRIDTPLNPPYHILFSGRISVEKGIFDIVDALSHLRKRRIAYIFDIVGMPENESVMDEFWKYAEKMGVKNKVQYHGYREVGEDLLSFYRMADVLIMASKSSEGFPRTIWEAFSQGTPVIASSVGSIPYFLRNEQDALITKPNCAFDLADALIRIFTDDALRRQLIANGYKLAQEVTLEKQAKIMIDKIREYLHA